MQNSDIIEDFIAKIHSPKCLTYELCPEKSGSVENLIKKVQKAGLETNNLTKEFIESRLSLVDNISNSLDSKIESSKNHNFIESNSNTDSTNTSCMQKNLQDSKNLQKDSKNIKNQTNKDTINIDAFVCTDSPLAILKQNSGLASIKLQKKIKKPLICTISMRDRNSLALCGEIMGLNDFDIRLFLALSGDPLKLGDQPQAKAVFEGNSLEILRIISLLNQGKDSAENELKEPLKQIYAFSVINSYAKNMQILKNKMESKIKAGAIALFTQPIFDINVASELIESCEIFNKKHGKNCALMLGFFPVLRYKSAKFLHDKLPGVYIPDIWLENLQNALSESKENEREIGLKMSGELFKKLYETYPKIHFMNNNNTMIALRILKNVL
ncbi:5,10-methylenetetrahydrofolate reductase [Helicobacter saguini]|uniref:Methylenetetrahydrofolate reductase n=1 Tax=Helicobacter saguini TaxID=1548018 RepID=A0A347VVB1_9HELI|nr:methylenetetrahydrofolate reductase [Helicobacter saguini]MWV62499.1 5,10-methylenetetrahydrofolate reductase [Helicobacter saguini]MWV66828.1 5,10-methylenetetrahydrofolate reductase [Helicobacter saguini]MWV69178.1 5,10-methylenetetrahydrofolate reductase [Helicobacter saguini]MWV71267.1 5,10-methylenetetrahydrofolate reductase [Helicobacter saguini]TLD94215.1 5,10-methylenetetrahydrofolate reductase [Helicobacter saguini]